MDWASASFGAFMGIAIVVSVTSLALYPFVRRSYLLWCSLRIACFAAMTITLLSFGPGESLFAGLDNRALGEVALALGVACTGPFFATYVEQHIDLAHHRRHLWYILPLGIFAAGATLLGGSWPIFHQLHDFALLAATFLLGNSLFAAIRRNSRVAKIQAIVWGPLVLLGLCAFAYEFFARTTIPHWPRLVLGALSFDLIITFLGIMNGFGRVKLERDRALANIEAAEQMMLIDPLTNIANRRGLEQHFAFDTARHPSGLAIIDCDHFKRVNDTFGHEVGDRVLVAAAQALRSDDVFAARLGGEEFIILIYSDDWENTAEKARQRITQAVRAAVPDMNLSVTASAGLTALSRTDALSVAMNRADKALYAAKEAGRDRSVSIAEFQSDSAPLTQVA